MAAKPAEPLIKGPFGPNAGASIGWNQATAADNATTMASVTGADGPWGASVAYERNPQGKNFISAGWASGAGFASRARRS